MAVADDDGDDGEGNCAGVGDGVREGDGEGVGDGDGEGEGEGEGVGADGRRRACVGSGNRVGDGEGCPTNGSSTGSVSAALVDLSLGTGAGVRVDPGSDQSPTLFPLTKVVCNLV